MRTDRYAPIRDYAAIGDGRSVALVALDGSIDWFAAPAFDQATVFCALLDPGKGGRFALAPTAEFQSERRYLPRTNVLETTFSTASGTVRVTDALSLQRDGGLLPWTELARRIECVSGEVALSWRVEPRFQYGLGSTEVKEHRGVPVALGDRLHLAVLSWDAGEVAVSRQAVAAEFRLSQGESALVACILVDNEPLPRPTREEIETRFEGTRAAWERWIGGHTYEGPWLDAVERSALALKLLVYAPSGAIAAAPTTSLPERIGGDRNYDYRFGWVRDTALTVDALAALGLREQVHGSLSWLLRATASTHPRLQPFYTCAGRVPRRTVALELAGYRGSSPVQAGNDATDQLQLGSYGDLLETVDLYCRQGNSLDPETALRIPEVAGFVCRIWGNDDSGIWELQEVAPYTLSKISAWVALDRALRLAADGEISSAGGAVWKREAEAVRAYVEERCWSEQQRSYTFCAGSEKLDAAVLLAARNGFADPAGERMRGTVDAIRRELGAGGPLLYRYTGQETEEGAFLACSFWLVEALAAGGRHDEAKAAMEELLALANDVGLYSEEIDPGSKEFLGNFPQGLTHLALINAAAAVAEKERDDA